MPTERQILGAEVRATRDAYEKRYRKPLAGGFIMPAMKKVYAHLSRKFGMSSHELSFFFTYSRSCTHDWSEGACDQCPK